MSFGPAEDGELVAVGITPALTLICIYAAYHLALFALLLIYSSEPAIKQRSLFLITLHWCCNLLFSFLDILQNGPVRCILVDGDERELASFPVIGCAVYIGVVFFCLALAFAAKLLQAANVFSDYYTTRQRLLLTSAGNLKGTSVVEHGLSGPQKCIVRLLRFTSRAKEHTNPSTPQDPGAVGAPRIDRRQDRAETGSQTLSMKGSTTGVTVVTAVTGMTGFSASLPRFRPPAISRRKLRDALLRLTLRTQILVVLLLEAFSALLFYFSTFFSGGDGVPLNSDWSQYCSSSMMSFLVMYAWCGLWFLVYIAVLMVLWRIDDPNHIRTEMVFFVLYLGTAWLLYALYPAVGRGARRFIYSGQLPALCQLLVVLYPIMLAIRQRRRRKSLSPTTSRKDFELTVLDPVQWEAFKEVLAKSLCLENAMFVEDYRGWRRFLESRGFLGRDGSVQRMQDGLATEESELVFRKYDGGQRYLWERERDAALKSAIRQLVKRYVETNSVHELNISSALRNAATNAINNPYSPRRLDFTVLSPIYAHVLNSLYLNQYPIFVRRQSERNGRGNRIAGGEHDPERRRGRWSSWRNKLWPSWPV